MILPIALKSPCGAGFERHLFAQWFVRLEEMLVPLLIVALVGCTGLFAALRPEAYVRYFLAESQRRAFSGNLRGVSITGWIIFGACTILVIAIPLHSMWNPLAPVFGPLFFLVCATAYVWWGIGLLRKPHSFLERTTSPWNRLPIWAVKGFGTLLLLGAVGFVYGFAVRITGLLR